MEITFKATNAVELKEKIANFCKHFDISHSNAQASLPFNKIQPSEPVKVEAPVSEPGQEAEPRKRGRKSNAEKAAAEAEKVEAEEVAATPTAPVQSTVNAAVYSKEQVTSALQSLNSKKGLTACREILAKFGQERLSSLPAEQYGQFMQECAARMQ